MQKLEQMGYGSLYYDDDMKPGFANTHASRMQAVATLRAAIAQGDFRTCDEPLLQELMQYQKENDTASGLEKFGAPKGLHDDLCVAAQRAQQIRLTIPMSAPLFAGVSPGGLVDEGYPRGRW
mgnify:FL=1